MWDVDFIELGTSDFACESLHCHPLASGLSVEPMKNYLDSLPDRPNIKKINCAISADNTTSEAFIYYVPEETIRLLELPSWLKGCNSINIPHKHHLEDRFKHLVVKSKVKQIPISTLLTDHNIRGIQYLKIDVEGGDSDILLHLWSYLETRPFEYWPKKILFESDPSQTSATKIEEAISAYANKGYVVTRFINETLLVLVN